MALSLNPAAQHPEGLRLSQQEIKARHVHESLEINYNESQVTVAYN